MTTEASFSGKTLRISRTYSAPREIVFEAWVETSKVQKWWGCADTTAVRSEIEPKVGGAYSHYMTIHGDEYPSLAQFVEFDPPKRLAYASMAPDGAGAMKVTVDFIEVAGGTRVELVHDGIPTEGGPGMPPNMPEIIEAGWTAAFGKLSDFLIAEAA